MNKVAIPFSLMLVIISAFIIGLGACSGNLEESSGTTVTDQAVEPVIVTVNILGNRMDPQAVTIPVGSTVIFHNTTSADHGIVSDVFDADLQPGQDFQYTFAYAGIYQVRSRTHTAATNLRCEIRVE